MNARPAWLALAVLTAPVVAGADSPATIPGTHIRVQVPPGFSPRTQPVPSLVSNGIQILGAELDEPVTPAAAADTARALSNVGRVVAQESLGSAGYLFRFTMAMDDGVRADGWARLAPAGRDGSVLVRALWHPGLGDRPAAMLRAVVQSAEWVADAVPVVVGTPLGFDIVPPRGWTRPIRSTDGRGLQTSGPAGSQFFVQTHTPEDPRQTLARICANQPLTPRDGHVGIGSLREVRISPVSVAGLEGCEVVGTRADGRGEDQAVVQQYLFAGTHLVLTEGFCYPRRASSPTVETLRRTAASLRRVRARPPRSRP